MADVLDTATGTVEGDVEQIKTAIYGREVRASIAEAISLLNDSTASAGDSAAQNASDIATLQAAMATVDATVAQNATAITALQESVEPLEEMLAVPSGTVHYMGVYADENSLGLVPRGSTMYMHYADGTTSADNPPDEEKTTTYAGVMYTIQTDGSYVLRLSTGQNQYGDWLNCGYKTASTGGLYLFDEDGEQIVADADGDREQAGILYPESLGNVSNLGNHGVKGFLTTSGTKVYLQDLLDRISALETAVEALQNGGQAT